MTGLTEQTARALEDAPNSSTKKLADELGLRAADLRAEFTQDLVLSPRDYAAGVKADRLRLALRRNGKATDAVFEAGYGSMSRVYEVADLELGMTPASYGLKGRGAVIRYTIVPTPLHKGVGQFLLASTEVGICFTALGTDARELESDLRAAFAYAESIIHDDAALAPAVAEVIDLIAPTYRRTQTLSLPLDIQSTAFQRRVWAGLLTIPPGQTLGYQQFARQLGNGRAQRAVARACASNPVALLIPCHRIVKSSGLGGYRWGVAAKRALLAGEGALVALQPSA